VFDTRWCNVVVFIQNTHFDEQDISSTLSWIETSQQGCGEATIADLMGHSDPQTTRRYTHATGRAKRAAVETVRVAADRFCHNPATKQERPPLQVAVNA